MSESISLVDGSTVNTHAPPKLTQSLWHRVALPPLTSHVLSRVPQDCQLHFHMHHDNYRPHGRHLQAPLMALVAAPSTYDVSSEAWHIHASQHM
jgi:hypothetical protein